MRCGSSTRRWRSPARRTTSIGRVRLTRSEASCWMGLAEETRHGPRTGRRWTSSSAKATWSRPLGCGERLRTPFGRLRVHPARGRYVCGAGRGRARRDRVAPVRAAARCQVGRRALRGGVPGASSTSAGSRPSGSARRPTRGRTLRSPVVPSALSGPVDADAQDRLAGIDRSQWRLTKQRHARHPSVPRPPARPRSAVGAALGVGSERRRRSAVAHAGRVAGMSAAKAAGSTGSTTRPPDGDRRRGDRSTHPRHPRRCVG